MENILNSIRNKMINVATAENRSYMEAYMKNKFQFWGVKAPERKEVVKEVWPTIKPLEIAGIMDLVDLLWEQPEREAQYIAMDILHKVYKKLKFAEIEHIEKLILTKSWWDTVDFLAARIIGQLVSLKLETRPGKVEKWIDSEKLWLQRTALLFQMYYKDKTDFELMESTINRLKLKENFFIRKGIGWILRQYSKVNPAWVRHFIQTTNGLSNLSIKEASKYL
jgi:3-methyladenine DNA glycosylase AlkD